VSEYETFQHDVLVIGAGGRRTGAPRSKLPRKAAPSDSFASRCSARHITVMGRGWRRCSHGERRRPRHNWRVHFADHVARRPVSQQLAHGRAARKGSARSHQGARSLGRPCSNRTPRRAHSAAQLRAATGIRALAHVGDRTGLEMIRTLQDRTVHREQIKGLHGVHRHHAAQGR